MVRHNLQILQQMLQDFERVSGHFGTLRIRGLVDPFCTNVPINFNLVQCPTTMRCVKNIKISGNIDKILVNL